MHKASFDTWTIIFLFASIQGCFVSLVLLFRKDKHPSRKILALITFLFSFILFAYVLFWTGYEYYYPQLLGIPDILFLTFGPLFYLYFKSVFNKRDLRLNDALHFIPFLIFLIQSLPFIAGSVQMKQNLLDGLIKVPGKVQWIIWIGIVQLASYMVIIFRSFSALSRSSAEVRRWFNSLSGLYAGFVLSYTSYYILVRFPFFNPAWDYAISFSMMFFIYFLAWFGYMQPKIFNGFYISEVSVQMKYKNSPVSADVSSEIIMKLNDEMNRHKHYLNNDLSLEKLSDLIDVNKHYLSQAINENMKMNFFEYINSLRIRDALELLSSGSDDLNIIEIAYAVGYNNKVSFYKAFRNIAGCTPLEYKKQLQMS